jgi:hypothetical protein
VITYIKNQQEHHGSKSFREEYIETLEKHDIPVNDENLFDELV